MAHSMGIPRGDRDDFVTCSRCKLTGTKESGDFYAVLVTKYGGLLVNYTELCRTCRHELEHFCGLIAPHKKGGDGQAQSQSQSWTPGK